MVMTVNIFEHTLEMDLSNTKCLSCSLVSVFGDKEKKLLKYLQYYRVLLLLLKTQNIVFEL